MEDKQYRFGIIKNRWFKNKNKAVAICNCGQHMIGEGRFQTSFTCTNCRNEFFIYADNQNTERFVIPYLEIIRKDNRGFKVARTNLSVVYKDGFVKPLKENLKRTIDFDMIDKSLKVWRNDELEFDSSINTLHSSQFDRASRMFFERLDDDVFIEFVSNEVTRSMYAIAKKLRMKNWGRKKDNLLYGFVKFSQEYMWAQILANAGIPEVERFYEGYAYAHRTPLIDATKTKPHEILRVPKFMMQYIREDTSIDLYVLKELQRNIVNRVDHNKFREIMSIVKDESDMKQLSNCIENLMQVHIDYEYTNLKKLVLYIFRETRMNQGITRPTDACVYLKDYIRMSKRLNVEYEKYPKSLKKEHDIVQMNYNLLENKNKLEEFRLSVEKKSYQELAYKDKEYAIVIPDTPDDLVKEGSQLSHCVASYVEDVTNDRCKILFMRSLEDLTKPLATIEVRGYNIRQARGRINMGVNQKEREFIKKWANENKLIEAYY